MARPTCWRRCRCWFRGVACGVRATPICRGRVAPAAGRWLGASSRWTARRTSAPAPCPAARPDRRVFRLDGATPRSQAEIAARVAAVWLTPQMDRLFLEGASGRRRFLDRLVWALEPGHAREVAAHDAAMAQRNRLLAEGRAGPVLARRSGGRDGAPRGGGHRGAHGPRCADERRAAVPRLSRGAHATGLPDRRRGSKRARRWRWRTGCAKPSPPGGRATPTAGSTAVGAHRTDMVLTDAATGAPAALA